MTAVAGLSLVVSLLVAAGEGAAPGPGTGEEAAPPPRAAGAPAPVESSPEAPVRPPEAAAPAGGAGPVEPAEEFHRPTMEDPGCIKRSLVIQPYLVAGLPPNVTVKFAILVDGRPVRFEVLTEKTDRRVAEAIWSAVKKCVWNPGTDPKFRPTSMWVVLPIRFR